MIACESSLGSQCHCMHAAGYIGLSLRSVCGRTNVLGVACTNGTNQSLLASYLKIAIKVGSTASAKSRNFAHE